MKKHLAIMSKATIQAILKGEKKIETRFSQKKIAPFGTINRGDIVFMKPPGEDIIGQFRVKKVFSYEGLNSEDIATIFGQYGSQIASGDKEFDEKYPKDKQESVYGTLIFIKECEQFITSPIKIRKSDQRGWVVLE